jgi:hypothetical protein
MPRKQSPTLKKKSSSSGSSRPGSTTKTLTELRRELKEFVRLNKRPQQYVDVYTRPTHNDPAKYEFIKVNRDKYPIVLLCKAANITRSSYYRWLATYPERLKRAKQRVLEDQKIIKEIQKIGQATHYSYGRRRIKTYLEEKRKIAIGERRVARLMRQMNYGNRY